MRPNIHLQTESVTIWHGDSIDTMRELPENSIDSIVTDPPYGLSAASPQQIAETLVKWSTGHRDYMPEGRGFMGKSWDAFVPPPALWDEAMRILKPGGHLLAFAGSRTQDLMGMSIRLAGFEIRENIAWLYGSGFPKSLDVSKAIDKARTEDVEPVRVICRAIRAAMDARGLKSKDLTEHFDGCHSRLIDHWAARDTDSQPALPKWGQWEKLRDLLDLGHEHDAEVWRLNARKGTHGEAWESREITGAYESAAAGQQWRANYGFDADLTAKERRDNAATPEAERWQGWGTALKPAFEPVVVARKPLVGTVAQNVQSYGTGSLNIDATRIGMSDEDRAVVDSRSGAGFGTGHTVGANQGRAEGKFTSNPSGRWPANVVLDDTTAAILDQQSGNVKGAVSNGRKAGNGAMFDPGAAEQAPSYGDSGGASRFFYVAKAPKRERPVVDGVAHPTVKPLALMRWLVKLVTPPGGVVLDPFEGSGTTLEACLLEGFDHVGIEREQDYLPLIEARLDRQAGTLPAAA